jgi:hypothetical protein
MTNAGMSNNHEPHPLPLPMPSKISILCIGNEEDAGFKYGNFLN